MCTDIINCIISLDMPRQRPSGSESANQNETERLPDKDYSSVWIDSVFIIAVWPKNRTWNIQVLAVYTQISPKISVFYLPSIYFR